MSVRFHTKYPTRKPLVVGSIKESKIQAMLNTIRHQHGLADVDPTNPHDINLTLLTNVDSTRFGHHTNKLTKANMGGKVIIVLESYWANGTHDDSCFAVHGIDDDCWDLYLLAINS